MTDMALWTCGSCGCDYAVGLSRCPQCTSTLLEDTVPKISKLGGPSIVGQPAGQAEAQVAPTLYDGMTGDELKAACGDRGLPKSGSKAKLIARLVEHDAQLAAGSGEAVNEETGAVTPPGEPLPPVAESEYQAFEEDDLRAECVERGLSTEGEKPELIARLVEHDAQHPDSIAAENTMAAAGGGGTDEPAARADGEGDGQSAALAVAPESAQEADSDGDG